MGRCGGMPAYVMAIVLLVALFASSAKCRPEPLDVDNASGSNGGGNAMAELNSTAASVNGGSGSGDVKLQWCLTKNCVYEGRGNAPCYCCAFHMPGEPPRCYDKINLCHRNCV